MPKHVKMVSGSSAYLIPYNVATAKLKPIPRSKLTLSADSIYYYCIYIIYICIYLLVERGPDIPTRAYIRKTAITQWQYSIFHNLTWGKEWRNFVFTLNVIRCHVTQLFAHNIMRSSIFLICLRGWQGRSSLERSNIFNKHFMKSMEKQTVSFSN